jgi:hypothetical protein
MANINLVLLARGDLAQLGKVKLRRKSEVQKPWPGDFFACENAIGIVDVVEYRFGDGPRVFLGALGP